MLYKKDSKMNKKEKNSWKSKIVFFYFFCDPDIYINLFKLKKIIFNQALWLSQIGQ